MSSCFPWASSVLMARLARLAAGHRRTPPFILSQGSVAAALLGGSTVTLR